MNTSMIKIEGLTFSYGKKASVFRDFSLEMEAGKVIGLLGKNGTGKSTLLYLMSGLLRPQNGSVWMKGRDVQKTPAGNSGGYVFGSGGIHLT